MPSLTPAAQRIQDALHSLGFENQVIEKEQTTRTAKEAAQALGCEVAQIAKSLVFKTSDSSRPLLVIASGANRVDVSRLAAEVGEGIEKPDADFVLSVTGFVIGGVPPLGHRQPLTTFIDEDLLQYDVIWAAAGTPNAIFKLTPGDLTRMTGGKVLKVK